MLESVVVPVPSGLPEPDRALVEFRRNVHAYADEIVDCGDDLEEVDRKIEGIVEECIRLHDRLAAARRDREPVEPNPCPPVDLSWVRQ